MTHYVYILECGKPTYYTGYTLHLISRYMLHCSNKGAKYTKGRGPLNLVYVEEWPDKSSALKREYQIKKLKRKQKEKLIYGYTTTI